ncbi:hypothetical protein MPSEU_000294500 [Mayamaea pseudoterrestris]|nr:hypothetical protein MPSEU_000294500 [Mayamaea pseudoterrestris]
MFERTLTDVVKGIRASKRDTALYISQCIAEIKTEISSNDLFVKSNALQKLTFLQMLGYSMSWASFATIEVMSSPRFGQKRIGYLAASQGFTQDTEVILLTTNLLKKELRGAVGGGMHGVYEAGLAINCISNIVTEDLAMDLLPEITSLTAHPQPYLRKKAILCLFKVFMKYPQGLRLTFQKLQQALQDPNPSVVSCAVNVITELSDKNPRNYLHLAPAFFELLTKSSNNWMLIKVVKLLGSLVPEEPRLARKLLEPLANIVRNTQAKSLLYEAVYTITLCLPYTRKADGSMPAIVPDIVELSAKTLGSFVEETDQNLKYLGLVGFGSLLTSHPKVLSTSEYRPLILACLSDQDVTIRRRALDLLIGMTSRKNLMELVAQLMKHVQLASGSYRNDLVAKIIELCSSEKYSLLTDFGWYIDVLFHIGHLRGIETHGELLRSQITDVALRVLPIRSYAVRRSMATLLERDGNTSNDPRGDNGRGKNLMPQVLPALAWIVGEYSDLIQDAIATGDGDARDYVYDSSSQGCYHALLQVFLSPSNIETLHASVQKVYIQGAMKVFAAATADAQVLTSELSACLNTIFINLPVFSQSADVAVAERALTALELLRSLDIIPDAMVNRSSASSMDSLGNGQNEILEFLQDSSQQPSPSILRDVSGILNYLYKPSPMKPVGSKAQRKKRASTLGHSANLDLPVDLSVFSTLIEEEETYRITHKIGNDSVSFTQQFPQKREQSHVISVPGSNVPDSNQKYSAMQLSSGATNSFQHNGEVANGKSTSQNLRQGDPFYLSSTPSKKGDESMLPDSRFGTIQLSDSDEDDHVRRKYKQKKEKKAKQAADVYADAFAPAGDNLSSRGGHDVSSRAIRQQAYIHGSDDDDDDIGVSGLIAKKKGLSKEFSGLARVDLTTPLRDDEFMPTQTHRVVPDRQPEGKSLKKQKKTKKSKKAKEARIDRVDVEDLLDLGGFDQSRSSSADLFQTSIASELPVTTQMTALPATASTNPINTAFDDLLGLSVPSAPQTTKEIKASRPSTNRHRPWMRASIKTSGASGPQTIDWTQISLAYQVFSKHGSAMLVFRLENRSLANLLDVSIKMKGHEIKRLGSIAGGSSRETDKLGPFESTAEGSQECKGTLSTDTGSSVSFKVSVPVSAHFDPEGGVSLDGILQEFTSSGWFSYSSKIDILTEASSEDVFSTIAAFLRATEVKSGTPEAAAFAARSNSGIRVRALAKMKGRTVKIDVKSTRATVGKDIATDIKRLVF